MFLLYNQLGLSNNSTVKYLPGTSFTAVRCIFGTLHCCKIHAREENHIHSHTHTHHQSYITDDVPAMEFEASVLSASPAP